MTPSIHRGISSGKLKTGVFVLEGINSFATTYFFYLIYFYTRDKFNFGILQNLLLAAGLGIVYAVSAFVSGRIAQSFGYFRSVRWGAIIMAALFLIGCATDSLLGTLAIIVAGNAALALTWPALEALASEGESQGRLRSLVGIYNVVWAGTGALAYFTGGMLQQELGPKSIFIVPAGLLLLEAGLTYWLEYKVNREPPAQLGPQLLPSRPEVAATSIPAGVFLQMAWLANPFAYLSINTVISTIPTLAQQFHFSEMKAGFVCSIWLFSRATSFVFLRLWPRWHYRFRFLAGSFLAMILAFGAMLIARDFSTFVLSQVVFGFAIGLIYYSSLFYSMDVGESKGEHGGIHEAAIGLGNAAGPGVAAGALAFFPGSPQSGAIAVVAMLMAGFGGLFWMRFRDRT